jgi:hypothetical protein
MKKKFAKRWRLNWWDLTKTVGLTFITTALDLIYQALAMYLKDTSKPIDWEQIAIVAAISALGYLIKNISTTVPPEAVEHAAKEQGIITR